MDAQAERQYRRLDEHDKNIFDNNSEKIPAADWLDVDEKWKWKWVNGKRQERNIKRPHNIKAMYKACYAEERDDKYRSFLTEHKLHGKEDKYPK